MASKQSVYACQQCGHQSAKWLGKCPECGQWNSFVEEFITKNKNPKNDFFTLNSEPKSLPDIASNPTPRLSTNLTELDRLLGGGLVWGSVSLLGGEPGIGKSTLMLQVQNKLAKQNKKVFYLSGEESLEQIKLRAKRLGMESANIMILAENNLETALTHIQKFSPDFLVVDSIQTIYLPDLGSTPGSVSQIRECAGKLLYYSKSKGVITWLVGQVTKEGTLAGPKILEHLVDTVLYFEGDQGQSHRILRTFKNRFGATHEVAVFEMVEHGLKEVINPSEFFLSHMLEQKPGSVVVSSLEGTRPILAELQALVVQSHLGTPRRVSLGVDANRVSLLAAVLEKICGYALGQNDIFINIVGGLSISEPAIDLGILLAMTSSLLGKKLPKQSLVVGEVGLTGEVRAVTGMSFRLSEAAKLGYQKIIFPKKNLDEIKNSELLQQHQLELYPVGHVQEALELFR